MLLVKLGAFSQCINANQEWLIFLANNRMVLIIMMTEFVELSSLCGGGFSALFITEPAGNHITKKHLSKQMIP